MSKNIWVMAAFVAIALSGCGGGGGTTPSSPATQTTSAPTVSLSIDQSKVKSGQSANLTWTSTNATSCTASGAWSGSQATSGSVSVMPSSSGKFAYTLTCSGSGGNGNQSVSLTVPIPVARSSYENKIQAGEALGSQPMPDNQEQGDNAIAFADFFQDGTYSMVTHSIEYNVNDPSTATDFGHIRFWKKVNGAWVDHTSDILSNNAGCLHPRKAIVADLNGDGIPDVFFACHGFDASPYSGEQPHMLLSQTDSTYKNITLPITCYCHSATAADTNGSGFANVMVTDTSVKHTPFFLINNKDGTFTQDLTRLPASLMNMPIYTVELIDFSGSGKYDVFIGANVPGQYPGMAPTILPNDGADRYVATTPISLPLGPLANALPLDTVFANGSIYLLEVNTATYAEQTVRKINYSTLAQVQLSDLSKTYPGGSTWIDWIESSQGNIVSLKSLFGYSVPE